MIQGARKGNRRETEKPKVEGWAAKRRFSMVDFPEPDGPVITIGRWVSVTDPQTIHQSYYIAQLSKKDLPVGAITECPTDLTPLKRKLD